MTKDRVRFETDVPGIWGLWPATPLLWSYSSLKEIEACPRRWMLSRADYPDVWEGRGYPALPVIPAIFGNVVHGVIERLSKKLGDAGITSLRAGDVVDVLGSLGGWRGIVLNAIERELSKLDSNPRITSERINRVRDQLIRRAPEAADQIKAFLGRGPLPAASVSRESVETVESDTRTQRYPAGLGSHAEREVTAEALRLTGQIDRLVLTDADVTVTDFKTGLDDDAHAEQVRLYALLWRLDSETNPASRPATKLRVAYPSHERAVEAPDATQLKLLETTTAARIEVADVITQNPPPTASPGKETCRYCHVKHLCDAYWPAVPPPIADVSADEWFDFEGQVLRRNGLRSWYVEPVAEPADEVLVRTVETDVAFPIGKRVRLLGVRRSQDPDTPERLVISMVSTSEWYVVSS